MCSVHFYCRKLHFICYFEWQIRELEGLQVELEAIFARLIFVCSSKHVGYSLSRVLTERMRVPWCRCDVTFFVLYMSKLRAQRIEGVDFVVELACFGLDAAEEYSLSFETFHSCHRVSCGEIVTFFNVKLFCRSNAECSSIYIYAPNVMMLLSPICSEK